MYIISFRYIIHAYSKVVFQIYYNVFVNHEMGTLHHGRCRNMSNTKILKTLNELNS